MEYLEPLALVTDVVINDETSEIKLFFANNQTETINKGHDGYMLFYNEWLKNEPIFISDKFKAQLRDITLYGLNKNNDSFNNLNKFFVNENKTNMINFFNYMRNRDLTYDKSIWKKV